MKKEEKIKGCPILNFITEVKNCCRDNIRSILPEEFIKHMDNSKEEFLLALRSLIDFALVKTKQKKEETKVEEVEVK
jgi:hypothetical protein